MREYHKIQTVFLRDPETNHRTLLEGQYAEPAFEFLAGNRWVFTEKVDGTNIRIIVDRARSPAAARWRLWCGGCHDAKRRRPLLPVCGVQ